MHPTNKHRRFTTATLDAESATDAYVYECAQVTVVCCQARRAAVIGTAPGEFLVIAAGHPSTTRATYEEATEEAGRLVRSASQAEQVESYLWPEDYPPGHDRHDPDHEHWSRDPRYGEQFEWGSGLGEVVGALVRPSSAR